jgi:hypothetical protein
MEIAQTILAQLGNGRFAAMTGAKHFVADTASRSLSFKLPRGFAAKGIGGVRIQLEDSDTYTVEFLRLKRFERSVIASYTGVYAEDLRRLFTSETGLDTHL